MILEIPTELPARPETPDFKKYLGMLIIAVACNALVVGGLVIAFGAMVAAKCLFIEIAVGIGLLFIAIFFFHADIARILFILESLAEQGRDETVVEMRAGRAQLRQISAKLEQTIHPQQHEDAMHDLVQHAMPFVRILVNKEKNWVQIGMFGWKLAQDAMRVMKQLKNN